MNGLFTAARYGSGRNDTFETASTACSRRRRGRGEDAPPSGLDAVVGRHCADGPGLAERLGARRAELRGPPETLTHSPVRPMSAKTSTVVNAVPHESSGR